jgi:hypothetical protein
VTLDCLETLHWTYLNWQWAVEALEGRCRCLVATVLMKSDYQTSLITFDAISTSVVLATPSLARTCGSRVADFATALFWHSIRAVGHGEASARTYLLL